MKHASIIVRAIRDDEAGVLAASSTDIDGLAVEEDAGFVGRQGVRHDLVSLGELLRFRLITFALVALVV